MEQNFADPSQWKCHDDGDFTFVSYPQESCHKWDSNPHLQRRLRPERSTLYPSAILTHITRRARVDGRFNFVKLVTEIESRHLLTDAWCFLNYSRLNVFVSTYLPVWELNPDLPRDGVHNCDRLWTSTKTLFSEFSEFWMFGSNLVLLSRNHCGLQRLLELNIVFKLIYSSQERGSEEVGK